MSAFAATVSDLLAQHGATLLFVLVFLETSFVTGLVVPASAATAVATILALEGGLSLPAVIGAALAGGAVGDSVGYWIGRRGGPALRARSDWVGRSFRRHHDPAASFFGRHPVYSVSLARLVSFVRTLMPMAAGMSGLRYRVFLPFQLLGLAGWAVMYVGIGVAARESWELVTSLVGTGWVVVFLAVGAVMWFRRRRQSAEPSGGRGGG